MCVLSINIINEKIYILLWFWFIILFITSILAVIWRFLSILIHAHSNNFNRFIFGRVFSDGSLNVWNNLTVTKHRSYSDWLFLSYLAENVDYLLFKQILIDLAKDISGKEEEDRERLLEKP